MTITQPHVNYLGNSMAVNSFSTNQVWCTSIGTTIGISISFMYCHQSQEHFDVVNSFVLTKPL